MGMRSAVLLLALAAACTPTSRSVEHALFDLGLDSVRVLGWAPLCSPGLGSHFAAREPVSGEVVTGRVCCARLEYACSVLVVGFL